MLKSGFNRFGFNRFRKLYLEEGVEVEEGEDSFCADEDDGGDDKKCRNKRYLVSFEKYKRA